MIKVRDFSKMIMVAGTIVFSNAYAQEGVPDAFVGARNVSLANANISESYDLSGMYQNPATISYVENGGVFLNHSQDMNSEWMQENLAFSILPKGPVNIASGLDVYRVGYLTKPAANNQRILEYGYDIAIASAVVPTLSVGASASLRKGWSGSSSQASAAYFTLGIDYAPTTEVNYGLVVGGLGTDVSYVGQDSGLSAVRTILPRTLEIGASMRYPSASTLREPIVTVSFANEKIFGESGVFYKAGLEIRPLGPVQLRFGYVLGPGVGVPRYGIGFLGNFFAVDYAIYPLLPSRTFIQQLSGSWEF